MRNRRLGFSFDDVESNIESGVSNAWNTVSNGLNNLDQTLLGPFSAQGAIDAANADAAPGGNGYLGIPGAVQNDIVTPLENDIVTPLENGFENIILLVGAAALIYFALEKK